MAPEKSVPLSLERVDAKVKRIDLHGSLEELLSDFEVGERMIARAKEEPEVRERANELATLGVLPALTIVEEIQDIGPGSRDRTLSKNGAYVRKNRCRSRRRTIRVRLQGSSSVRQIPGKPNDNPGT